MASLAPEIPDRLRAADHVRNAAEAVLVALVALAPWPFASVEPFWRLVLTAAIALLTLLWFVHVLLTRTLAFRVDAITLGLLGLIVLAAFQTVPLPESVVGVLSPTRLEYHCFFRPAVDELLPGEANAPLRPTWLPLSLDPARTRDSLVLLVAVFLTYVIARNFVFTKRAFARLAWVSFVNGVLLALVALMQFFSSPRTVVFWSLPTEGQVFGPFVCKNHYPYYLSLCFGLGLGLLLEEWHRLDRERSAYWNRGAGGVGRLLASLERLRSPKTLLLLGGLSLMLVSVPFSLSRGGLLAIVAAGGVALAVARLARKRSADARPASSGGVILILMIAVAVGLGAWFGWKPVEQRLDTLWQGSRVATGDRLPLWRDLAKAVSDFPLVGAGAGTTIHLEVMTRERPDVAFVLYNHAHNDYLEALIEGGLVRLGFTLLVVGSALWTAAVGYVRHRNRSAAPLLLGGFFGLTEIAVHSFGDFGIHIPAVALLTAVTAAFVMGLRENLSSRTETRRVRVRRRVRPGMETQPSRAAVEPLNREPRALVPTITGPTAVFTVGFAVLAGGLVVFEGWRAWIVGRWGDGAVYAATDYGNPDRMKRAAERIEGALCVRPDDPTLWNDLAAALLADAFDKAGRAAGAVAGPAAYRVPIETLPPEMLTSHVVPALRAARAARNLCPILPGPHLRLGSFATAFAKAESPATHFMRGKRGNWADADIRFLSGADALARGDREAAWEDWRDALSRSRSVLPSIVRAATKSSSAEELRTKVLPADPAIWLAAADSLYPDRDDAPPERKTFLRAAHNRWKAGPAPDNAADWLAWGRACEELGETADALSIWHRGVEQYPNSEALRDRLANRLETDEADDRALPHLEWLRTHFPNRVDLRDRLDAVKRAGKLRREIEGS